MDRYEGEAGVLGAAPARSHPSVVRQHGSATPPLRQRQCQLPRPHPPCSSVSASARTRCAATPPPPLQLQDVCTMQDLLIGGRRGRRGRETGLGALG